MTKNFDALNLHHYLGHKISQKGFQYNQKIKNSLYLTDIIKENMCAVNMP